MTEKKDKLSLDEIREIANKKAEELSAKQNPVVKVHPFIFKDKDDDGKWVVGYVKEPSRAAKAIAMDQTMMGKAFSIGQSLCQACLIKEESDPRTYSELPENDDYVLGAWSFVDDLVVIAIEHSKKK